MAQKNATNEITGFASPAVGSACTILSGLVFLFLSMILGIVGPAAMHGSGSPGATRAAWFTHNAVGFFGILVLCLGLAVAATMSKLARRKLDGSPMPCWSIGLVMICLALAVAFATGLLAI